MSAAAEGDRLAFEQIVRVMTPRLIKAVRYYTSQNPEDILQDIWLKIWERVSVLASVERPEYWFYTVVRHHCYDKGRKAKSKGSCTEVVPIHYEAVQNYMDMMHGAMADYEDPEKLLVKAETAQFMRQKIDCLKEMYALPIYLYYFDDMLLAEIGELLDLSVSTVKWRLYTGRQLLKKEIEKHDY